MLFWNWDSARSFLSQCLFLQLLNNGVSGKYNYAMRVIRSKTNSFLLQMKKLKDWWKSYIDFIFNYLSYNNNVIVKIKYLNQILFTYISRIMLLLYNEVYLFGEESQFAVKTIQNCVLCTYYLGYIFLGHTSICGVCEIHCYISTNIFFLFFIEI